MAAAGGGDGRARKRWGGGRRWTDRIGAGQTASAPAVLVPTAVAAVLPAEEEGMEEVPTLRSAPTRIQRQLQARGEGAAAAAARLAEVAQRESGRTTRLGARAIRSDERVPVSDQVWGKKRSANPTL